MDDIIKNCVESRKTAILGIVDPENDDALSVINNFFERLEEFAKKCSSVTDFEEKFQTSSLQEEYANLFTRFMNNNSSQEEENMSSEIKNEIIDDMYHRGRREVRQEAYDRVRDIPVVGEVLNVKQHLDFFNRFRKKKDN